MQMGPELSDAQRINAKMMRFMPFMFLVFLYFFSSALVLYWTVQNLMTILQTLITKNAPDPKEGFKQEIESEQGTEENNKVLNEISEEERTYRNLLGLKSRGPIDSKALENNYQERAKNYTDARLEEMNSSKKRLALNKKQRLEQAYQFLLDILKK